MKARAARFFSEHGVPDVLQLPLSTMRYVPLIPFSRQPCDEHMLLL